MSAARRRGKWVGGQPVLGYDVAPGGGRLIVNAEEAARVRAIYHLYLDHKALIPVVREIDRRGWLTKRWTTRKGIERGGRPFTKNSLHRLLTNVTCAGKVNYKGCLYEGEHDALVETDLWQRVQDALRTNARTGGRDVRNKYEALLKGLLSCTPCGTGMAHVCTGRNVQQPSEQGSPSGLCWPAVQAQSKVPRVARLRTSRRTFQAKPRYVLAQKH